MNRQQHKTLPTNMNNMMLSHQLNDLIVRSNLKPEITSHSQNRHEPAIICLNSSLSVESLDNQL